MLHDLTEELTEALRADLPEGILRAVPPSYLLEPRDRLTGRAGALALPRSVAEVSAVLAACNARGIAVVPYGGGTGLVGGQVAPEGPVPLVLSLERMKAVRAIYPEENVIIAEAGAILADVQAAAEGAGRLFPLSLASEGSARIGGLLGTNAGGVNVLRYGNARELCLGVEAVLADGRVMRGLRRLRKDNTGYDLRGLLVGAEGTLGVITAAALRLFPRPAERAVALIEVASPAAALKLLGRAQEIAGQGVSAFELIAAEGPRFIAEQLPEQRLPWPAPPAWCVLLEIGAKGAAELVQEVFAAGLEAGLARDGLLAESEAQAAAFWAMRESIPEANRKVGAIVSNDISLPLGAVPEFISRAGAAIAGLGDLRINCFGHLGDGNLHYNIFPPAGERREAHAGKASDIKAIVNDLLAELEGSFSAEHGVGRVKVSELETWGDPVRLAAMRAIKTALDPNGILNPGAVLRNAQKTAPNGVN